MRINIENLRKIIREELEIAISEASKQYEEL